MSQANPTGGDPGPGKQGDQGGAGGGGNGTPVLSSRLANRLEVVLTALFLLLLTLALLAGITWFWPWCKPTSSADCTPAPAPPPAGGESQQQGQTPPDQNKGPVIRSVAPGSGSINGGKVTISGENLTEHDIVSFDQCLATTNNVTPNSMIAQAPPHEQGSVDVTIWRGTATSTLADGYKYVCPAPEGRNLFLMLLMAGALGGCIHALRSLFWYAGNEELRVPWLLMYFLLPFVGAAMAMIFSLLIVAGFINNTTGQSTALFIIAIGGLVGMFSQQAALKLTDIANATFTKPGPGNDSKPQESQSVGAGAGGPMTPHIAPNSGPAGTKVTVTGTGFADVKAVTFGGVAAKDAAFDEATSNVTATAPEHAPGTVDVVVTNGAGKTVTLSYTYTAAASGPPGGGATLKIDPPSGPAADSTPVAITGTGFSDVDAVLFGDNPSEPPATLSADKTTVNATAPPNPEGGEVTVTVKNKAGDARTLKYEYKN